MHPENPSLSPERTARGRWGARRVGGIAGTALIILLLLAILIAATLPVSWARDRIARHIADRVGAPVTIGALTREPAISLSPMIIVHDLRIAQPAWAGPGDFVRVAELRLRVSLLPALLGRGLRPKGIEARGLVASLVRDANGRSNWGGQEKERRSTDEGLSHLLVPDGRFTLRDEKRHLALSGRLVANAGGTSMTGVGRFHEAPVTVRLDGPAIFGRDPAQPYPFRLSLFSPLLDLRAHGRMVGAFNLRDMALDMTARAPSLKYLDDIIQAGLFGSQPIDLRAHLRHQGQDWFIDRLAGRIGRSPLVGHATILKRGGRSKIDAALDFTALDFDDLADDQGLSEQAALKARIGNRVLPNTRINLSKVGPTDGQIRFAARKLLFNSPSVFRSLKGIVLLEGKVLTLDNVEANLTDGRMTGRLVVDHRKGLSPMLDVDLRFIDGRLGPLLNASDKVDVPFRARVRLAGRGDTIRAALSKADGDVGFVAANGRIARVAAAVLAQDMGKTIGASLDGEDETVSLNCIAVGFSARQGRLSAAPFIIDTGTARSRGMGEIDLDGERIALAIGGQARKSSGLPIIDPIRIGGTLSQPALEISGVGKNTGSIVGAVIKSIGGALGLADKKGPEVTAMGPVDCPALSRRLLDADR